MEPSEEKSVDAPDAPLSRRERAQARTAALQARAKRIADRAQEERGRHGTVDALFEIADRDAEVGGGILAGALAYRFFIFLLPLALVAVAGIGIGTQAASSSPEAAAKSMGIAGLVSHSVAGAAKSQDRWYALLIGIPLVIYATRSVLRTLIVSHRLAWTDVRRTAHKPTIKATLQLLALFIGFLGVSLAATTARQSSSRSGLLAVLVIAIPYAALMLLVSLSLPHRTATWRDLWPGAVLFGFGIEALHLVIAYFIAPETSKKQGTYGSLGLAAALLLGLFLVSRLIVATAVLNATLWERKQRRAQAG